MLGLAAASLAATAVMALALSIARAGFAPFDVPIYRHLLYFQDYYAIAPYAALVIAALFAPVQSAGARLARVCAERPGAVALATIAALAIGAHLVYHLDPLSLDEYAVLFQSKVFASGHLTGKFPPDLIDWLIPRFFQGRFIRPAYDTGEVVSIYWPGFSLLLTPFTLLGAPWLLNPLLTGATLLVLHRIALALFHSREAAGYVVLLTLASPVVLVDGLSYYSMPAHLLASALYCLLLLEPTPRRAFLAGLTGSLALVLHNPAPHLFFALPWIAWLALRPDRWRLLGALAAGYLPLALTAGFGWPMLVESLGRRATVEGMATPSGAAGLVAQVVGRVLGWTSTTGTWFHLSDLAKLWLWSAPALPALALLGARHVRADRGPWLPLAGSALLTYFGYFLVQFDQGHGWGFRYFHAAWLVLPLFAVRGLQSIPALRGYIAAAALLGLAVLVPFRSLQVEQFIARHLRQVPDIPTQGRAMVLLDLRSGYHSWDLLQNDPYLRNRVLMLASRGLAADQAMMAARFPGYRLVSRDARGAVWAAPR